MRDIKFKAIECETEKWVFGYYMRNNSNIAYIRLEDNSRTVIVDYETVCEFTGLQDRRKIDLFEGDIFLYEKHKGYALEDFKGEIKFIDGCFGYVVIDGENYKNFTSLSEIDELQNDFLNHIMVVDNVYN